MTILVKICPQIKAAAAASMRVTATRRNVAVFEDEIHSR